MMMITDDDDGGDDDEVDATLWLSDGAYIHMWTCAGIRFDAVSVGWGMHSRSCVSAHEVDALGGSGWHNMYSCGAGDQACRIQIQIGSWKNLKRCCGQTTAENMWKQIS